MLTWRHSSPISAACLSRRAIKANRGTLKANRETLKKANSRAESNRVQKGKAVKTGERMQRIALAVGTENMTGNRVPARAGPIHGKRDPLPMMMNRRGLAVDERLRLDHASAECVADRLVPEADTEQRDRPTDPLDELERRDLNTALITMCTGGGMAPAIIIERV